MKPSEASSKTFLGFSVPALIIIFLSVALRSIGLHRPLLGHFSMYQTANAMMAKFFLANHFTDIFHPQVNVLVSGKPGLLLLAYPLNALIAAVLNAVFGGSLDYWGRFQALLFFTGTAVILYRFVKKRYSEQLALISVTAFSLSPISIIYAQSFQNEMATLFFTLLFLCQFSAFLKKARIFPAAVAVLAAGFVLITRPNLLYIFALSLTLTVFENSEIPFLKRILRWAVITACSMLTPAAWYGHIWQVTQQADNIYSTLFVQLAVRSSFVSPIIFTLDYHQQLIDTFTQMVVTPMGLFLLLWGIFTAGREFKKYSLWLIWLICFTAAGAVMPRKLIDHNFYFLYFVPPAAVVIGAGIQALLGMLPARKLFLSFLIVLTFAVSMRYALHPAFKTTEEDKHLLHIAGEVKALTSKDTSRIAVQGTHPLLYYSDRYGWPFSIVPSSKISDYYTTDAKWEKISDEQREKRNKALGNPISNLEYLRSEEGATHFAVINPAAFNASKEFSDYMCAHYKITAEEENVFILFDLKEKS